MNSWLFAAILLGLLTSFLCGCEGLGRGCKRAVQCGDEDLVDWSSIPFEELPRRAPQVWVEGNSPISLKLTCYSTSTCLGYPTPCEEPGPYSGMTLIPEWPSFRNALYTQGTSTCHRLAIEKKIHMYARLFEMRNTTWENVRIANDKVSSVYSEHL